MKLFRKMKDWPLIKAPTETTESFTVEMPNDAPIIDSPLNPSEVLIYDPDASKRLARHERLREGGRRGGKKSRPPNDWPPEQTRRLFDQFCDQFCREHPEVLPCHWITEWLKTDDGSFPPESTLRRHLSKT